MLAPDGAACMTVHRNLTELYTFVRHLAASLKLKERIPFEISRLGVQHYKSSFRVCRPWWRGLCKEFTWRMFIAEETIDNACNGTYSNEVSPITTDTEDSSAKDGNNKLDSSVLSSCIDYLNDSATFIETFDTNCFDTISSTRHDDDDDDDDDDGAAAAAAADDDDIDYIADESENFDSSDSEHLSLAELRKIERSKKKCKKASVMGQVSETEDHRGSVSNNVEAPPLGSVSGSSLTVEGIYIISMKQNESDVTGFSKFDEDRVSQSGDHSQSSQSADYITSSLPASCQPTPESTAQNPSQDPQTSAHYLKG